MTRRVFRSFAAAAVSACVLTMVVPASAEDAWPQRPVTIVVPFRPAARRTCLRASCSSTCRQILASRSSWKIARAREAASARRYVAKAPNDGYTLLLGTLSGHVLNQFIYGRLPYDPERDFQPVSQIVSLAEPVRRQPEDSGAIGAGIVAYLKPTTARLTYGSSGVGTSSHLSVIMLQWRPARI